MIIVDGYNAIYKWKSLKKFIDNMDLACSRLINILANYQGYVDEELVIVLDSCLNEAVSRSEVTPQNIQVIYAPARQGADLFIERMVCSSSNPQNITVVTADVMEKMSVIRNGANTISPGKFEKQVMDVTKKGERV